MFNELETNHVVDVKKVTFTYGCHPVLQDISFFINQGEAVGLTGPNGAGKTTLLRLITGQLTPQSGTITLFGQEPCVVKNRALFSYLPQKATYFNPAFPASVKEVVMSGLVAKKGLFRLFTSADDKLAKEALHIVGLDGLEKRPIWSLSGGQQQRVFMARALINQPQLVILDEPTVGLDIESCQEFNALLVALNQNYHVTLLIVSHDIEWLSGVINKKICLDVHACSCRERSNFLLAHGRCFA